MYTEQNGRNRQAWRLAAWQPTTTFPAFGLCTATELNCVSFACLINNVTYKTQRGAQPRAYFCLTSLMKYLSSSLLLYLYLLLDDLAVSAVRIPVVGKQVPRTTREWVPPQDLSRRVSISAGSDLKNIQDVRYYTNVSLGGQPFQVLIDTGR